MHEFLNKYQKTAKKMVSKQTSAMLPTRQQITPFEIDDAIVLQM